MTMNRIATIDGIEVFHDEDTNEIVYRAALMVDADGSPNAYVPNNSGLHGLDYLANAGYSGNWWALAKDRSGVPYIQTTDMPTPGAYISTTALQNHDFPENDPRRYVNSEEIPFIVLPPQAVAQWSIKLGAAGTIEDLRGGNVIGVIFADIGPRNKLGEASIAAAKALGVNPDPKKGGTDERRFEYRVTIDKTT